MQQFNHFNQSNQYSEQTRLENKWDHSSGLRNYSHYSHWCLRDVHQLSSHIKNNEVTALVWWFLLAVACQCFSLLQNSGVLHLGWDRETDAD